MLDAFVNGAYETGFKAATEVLKCINGKDDCKTYWDESDSTTVFGGSCIKQTNGGHVKQATAVIGYLMYLGWWLSFAAM